MRDDRDDRLRLLAIVAPLFGLAYTLLYLRYLDTVPAIPRDGTGLVVGRDFLNTWMVGRIAWGADPARFYDIAAYQAEVAKVTGPAYLGQVWSYPPSQMLIGAPLARLPYLGALAVWTVLGGAIFYAALKGWSDDRRVHVALLLCPAAVFGIISGQLAFVAAALILTVLRWRQAKPWTAGALLGLLTIKPQLGLFFPFMLLAARDWRVIGGALVSAAAVIATTIALWGVAPWKAYLTIGIATQSAVLSDPLATIAPFMPTIFMNLRSAGVGVDVASAIQGMMAVGAAGLIVWRFWRQPPASDTNANALFLCAAASGTAYMLSYDTLAMTAAVVLASPPGKTGRWLMFGVYFLFLLQIPFGNVGFPGPALIPLAMAIYLAKQAASSTCVDQRNWPTGSTQAS
ncbi:MAG: glycosyltransferase family 87 protein [Sphingomicrobium sp.]